MVEGVVWRFGHAENRAVAPASRDELLESLATDLGQRR